MRGQGRDRDRRPPMRTVSAAFARRRTGSACAGRRDSWRWSRGSHCAASSSGGERRTQATTGERSARSCNTSTDKCAFGSHAEEIRRRGDVVGGIAIAGVAEISRQHGQERLHVGLLPVPDGEAGDGEAVPQIMRPQDLAIVETRDPAGGSECWPEDPVGRQPIAPRTEEKCCGPSAPEMLHCAVEHNRIAPSSVVVEPGPVDPCGTWSS